MSRSSSFDLQPIAPFRLDLTVWTLRRRAANLIDRWDGSTYRRVLVGDDGDPFEVTVSQTGSIEAPRLTVIADPTEDVVAAETVARRALDRLLGIRIDLSAFYAAARQDGDLGALASRFRGFKPPRFATYFETLVNAMACQQISIDVGIQLLGRLAERYGRCLQSESGAFHAFPRPEDAAGADIEELRKLGFSYQKARYITELAQVLAGGRLNLATLESLDDEQALARLREIKGVGRWTAQYFLLRGLGRTHIFPADDVGAQKNLQSWLRLRGPMTYEKVHRALNPWAGYGGLVYLHLLLNSLEEQGVLAE